MINTIINIMRKKGECYEDNISSGRVLLGRSKIL